MPGWQAFVELNKGANFKFVAVAMDVGGVADATPLYKAAKSSYLTLVDPDNALGDALDFKVVPNGFLINEAGVIVQKWIGGFNVGSPRVMERVEAFLLEPAVKAGEVPRAMTVAEQLTEARTKVASDSGSASNRRSLAKLLIREDGFDEALEHLQKATELEPKNPDSWYLIGRARLAKEQKDLALEALRIALKLDPEDFIVRKQIWNIAHPEKFNPTIDWAWQREQLKKEREAEKGGGGSFKVRD